MPLAAIVLLFTPPRLPQTARLATRVTYMTRAAPAGRVLPELGRLVGQVILATPEIESEVLIIKVQDVPLDDVLKRIATVTSGKWEQRHGILVLRADPVVRERERLDEFKKDFAETKTVIEKDGDAEHVDGLLFQCVDAKVIAALAPGERAVFSTKPTSRQHAFTDDVLPKITKLVQSHGSQLLTYVQGRTQSPAWLIGPGAMVLRKIGPLSKAMLILTRDRFFGTGHAFTFESLLIDTSGNVACRSGDGGDYLGSIGPIPFDEDDDSWGHPPKPGPAIDFQPDSLQFLESIGGSIDSFSDAAVSPSLADKLLYPSRYDPLSFFQTDEILAVAALTVKPLVADIPDYWPKTGFNHGYIPTAASVEELVESSDIVSDMSDAAFTVLKPSNPVENRTDRMNRRALAKLVDGTRWAAVQSTEELSEFAFHSPHPVAFQLLDGYLMLVAPAVVDYRDTHWALLRLIGSLDAHQRFVLLAGGTIRIKQPSATQVRLVDQLVKLLGMGSLVLSDGSSGLVDGFPDPRTEVTEVAPPEANWGIELSAKLQHVKIAVRFQPDGLPRMGAARICTALNFAQRLYQGSPGVGLPRIGTIRLGERIEQNISIRFGPALRLELKFSDYKVPSNAKQMTDKDLPKDFQTSIRHFKAAIDFAELRMPLLGRWLLQG